MWYFILVIAIYLGERMIKNYVEHNRKFGEQTSIAKGNIIIQKYHNKGMALNLLEKNVKLVMWISGSLIGILLLLLSFLVTKRENCMYKLGLALILGGAISNFGDRLEKGYVVDYFSFNFGKKLKKIIFNLADMFIFIGSGFLILSKLLKE